MEKELQMARRRGSSRLTPNLKRDLVRAERRKRRVAEAEAHDTPIVALPFFFAEARRASRPGRAVRRFDRCAEAGMALERNGDAMASWRRAATSSGRFDP